MSFVNEFIFKFMLTYIYHILTKNLVENMINMIEYTRPVCRNEQYNNILS